MHLFPVMIVFSPLVIMISLSNTRYIHLSLCSNDSNDVCLLQRTNINSEINTSLFTNYYIFWYIQINKFVSSVLYSRTMYIEESIWIFDWYSLKKHILKTTKDYSLRISGEKKGNVCLSFRGKEQIIIYSSCNMVMKPKELMIMQYSGAWN